MIKVNNKYVPMNKSDFVDAINAIKTYNNKINNIQTVLEENCEDVIFWPPSLEDALIKTLVESFNDYSEMIDYFIYELDFGERWSPGFITANGQDIKMQTAEDLYDYLVDGLEVE